MSELKKRDLEGLGSSLKDLKAFPMEVKRQVGVDLDMVQGGEIPASAKKEALP